MTPSTSQITQWVAAHETELLELAREFVAIPSENRPPHGAEREFQHLFASTLSALGMDVRTFLVTDAEGVEAHPLYWPGRDYSDRPNVVGTLSGVGGGRSLLLSGHGDVVIGLPGKHPPFEPVIEEGRLYGRGSNDMKGGLAAAVMAIRCLRGLGVTLDGDLVFESVVDEELGGANGTLASRLLNRNPDAAVIMEPSNLVVCPAHLGGRTFRIRIRGAGGMGFGGMEIVNPIYAMAHLITAIESFAEDWRRVPAPSPELDPGRGLDTVLSIAQSGDFEPGQGDGVPNDGVLEVWIESFPGMTAAELDEAFLGFCRDVVARDRVLAKCQVSYEYVTRFLEGSSIPADHAIVKAAAAAMTAVLGADRTIVQAAPFACDGFILAAFGIPTLILGPSGDSAHSADEYVTCRSLTELTATLARLVADWCGVASGQGEGVATDVQ